MIIRETWLNSHHAEHNKVYRVPDVRYDDKSGYGYQKWARQVNLFFHRNAKDGIRFNRTNLRQFTEIDDSSYDAELRSHTKLTPDWTPPEIIDCENLDEFFIKVHFVYPTKTWRNRQEWAMKIQLNKHESGGVSVEFVNP
jgi:hypothetical protein